MTVTSSTDKIGPTEGNSSGTTFSSFPIVYYDLDHVKVTHLASNGVETPLIRGTGTSNFSAAFTDSVNLPSTVTVTYPAAGSGGSALPAGEFLTITRNLPYTQEVNLENQGGYFPEVQEQLADELVMRMIQIQEELDRSFKIPISDDGDLDMELPTSTERASKLLGFNAEGEPIASDATVDSALTTTFTKTILDDTDAQEVLSTLSPSGVFNLRNEAATEATDPNDEEYLISFDMKGPNDNEEVITYAAIKSQIATDDDGDEDGRILFFLHHQGSEDYYMKLGAGPTLQLLSWSNDATANPKLQLFRKSQSAADEDLLGQIVWQCNHDGSVTLTGPVDVGNIQMQLDDATEDSEDTHFEFNAMVAGSMTEVMSVGTDGLVVNGEGIYSLEGGLSAATSSTSGTTVAFTDIRDDARRITINFMGVSTDGTEELLVQIGNSGGLETTSYTSAAGRLENSSQSIGASTSGFQLTAGQAATDVFNGSVILTLADASTNTWVSQGILSNTVSNNASCSSSGMKALSATLDRLTITTTGTPDDFDAGSISILVE